MNGRSVCRFCTFYRPDERWRGKMGWCDKHNRASSRGETCVSMKEGKQYWLKTGIEVKE